MGRWLAIVALTALAFGLSACASNDPMADGSSPRESSIPWNRPQSWEGPGVYGSAMNQGQ
jgi:hypothetical protein